MRDEGGEVIRSVPGSKFKVQGLRFKGSKLSMPK